MEQKDYLLNNEVLTSLINNGYESYIVGGAVRDFVLKRPINDIDIATSAKPMQIKKLFKKTLDTGIEHGTITVILNNKNYEVTTFRKEKKYINYRKPSSVIFIKNIKQDIKRRDFTINAMLQTNDLKIIDYYKGLKHCKEKIIKTVGNPNKRFKEDALRMLRAVRFSVQLGFNINKKTWEAIKKHQYLLKHISKERITQEFLKTISGEYLQYINQLQIFPLFENLLFDNLIDDSDLVLRLASIIGIPKNLELLEFLTIDKKTKYSIKMIINNIGFEKYNDKIALKKLMNLIGINNCEKVLILKKVNLDMFSSIILNREPIFISDLKITGNDLKFHEFAVEGNRIGEILDLLLSEVWNDPKKNNINDLVILANSMTHK
ncbi:MAG: CCA tRNA nucleotidyltransferase [Clostridiales bacterium]|nr:CCA tRNA nucleotidyltransferase [Clostridiales bacterium]